MKTIYDKIDPKYLDHAATGVECATGTCQHSVHNINILYWMLLAVALGYTTTKYYYGTYRTRSRKN